MSIEHVGTAREIASAQRSAEALTVLLSGHKSFQERNSLHSWCISNELIYVCACEGVEWVVGLGLHASVMAVRMMYGSNWQYYIMQRALSGSLCMLMCGSVMGKSKPADGALVLSLK